MLKECGLFEIKNLLLLLFILHETTYIYKIHLSNVHFDESWQNKI